MERTQLFDLMGELKLYGMKAAFDEIMATAVKRQHEPQRIVGELLTAEVSEKQARSIRYQLTIAKLPLAKDLDDFEFTGTPINETLVRDLAGGAFLAQRRNAVLVGGTGTGKTHLAIAIARSCIRSGARSRFYNVVDLVNRLESETRNGLKSANPRIPIHATLIIKAVTNPAGGQQRSKRESGRAMSGSSDVRAGADSSDKSCFIIPFPLFGDVWQQRGFSFVPGLALAFAKRNPRARKRVTRPG